MIRLAYSLTAKAAANETFYYRSAASAGALYPFELYLASPELSDLKAGLYHYSIANFGLFPLREGNFFSFILQKASWPDGFVPGLTFFISAVFFRSSWKYRDRAFRYHLLDTGHLIENVLLALGAYHYSAFLTYDFNDVEINRFLGLDETLEGALALISLPDPSPQKERGFSPIDDLPVAVKATSRTARQEIIYPGIKEFYEAGKTVSAIDSVPPARLPFELEPNHRRAIHPPENWPEKLTYSQAVFRRRSKRNFISDPLSSNTFSALLEGLTLPIPALSEIPNRASSFFSMGLLTGSVEDNLPGFYLLDGENFQIGLVREGAFTKIMAHICLDQMWLANAAIHFLFLGNLNLLDNNWSPRGYRYAMMTAGRMGERLYLLATTLGLGCCGIGAFYDQEAADFLGLDEGNRLLYLLAVGVIRGKQS
jgi:SagB-type dehydrogenase family enzyme